MIGTLTWTQPSGQCSCLEPNFSVQLLALSLTMWWIWLCFLHSGLKPNIHFTSLMLRNLTFPNDWVFLSCRNDESLFQPWTYSKRQWQKWKALSFTFLPICFTANDWKMGRNYWLVLTERDFGPCLCQHWVNISGAALRSSFSCGA